VLLLLSMGDLVPHNQTTHDCTVFPAFCQAGCCSVTEAGAEQLKGLQSEGSCCSVLKAGAGT